MSKVTNAKCELPFENNKDEMSALGPNFDSNSEFGIHKM